jgi:hypothetical protein
VTPEELEIRLYSTPPTGLAWKSVSRVLRGAVPGAGSPERAESLGAAVKAFNEAVGVGVNSVSGIGAFLRKRIFVDSEAPGNAKGTVRIRFISPIYEEGFMTFTPSPVEEELMNLQFEAKRLIAGTMTQINAETEFEKRKALFETAQTAILKLERQAHEQANTFVALQEMRKAFPKKPRILVYFKAALHDELRAKHGRFAQRVGLIKKREHVYRP